MTLELWRDPENDGERSCCSASAVRARPRARAPDGPAAPDARPARRVPRRRRRAVARRPRRRADAEPVRALQRPRAPRRDARARRPPRRRGAGHRPLRARDAPTACCAPPPTRPRTRATCSPALAPRVAGAAALPARRADQARRCARSPREPALPVAAKPDSQDLCFLAGTGRGAFLARHGGLRERPGDDRRPRAAGVLGRHRGHHRYTVGQRRGLGRRRRGRAALRAGDRRRAPTPSRSARARRCATTRGRAARRCACTATPTRSTRASCATARRPPCRARCDGDAAACSTSRSAAPRPARRRCCSRGDVVVGMLRQSARDDLRRDPRDVPVVLRGSAATGALPSASLVPAAFDPSDAAHHRRACTRSSPTSSGSRSRRTTG